MKADLIVLIPSIQFDISESPFPPIKIKIKGIQAKDYFKFNKSFICSYKYLLKHKAILKHSYRKFIDEFYNKIIDSAGNKLHDFAVIIDREVKIDSLNIRNLNSEELLNFFAYKQNITHWVPIHNIKIVCFKGGGREHFINNFREVFSPKYNYLLPIEQNHKIKIWLGQSEITLKKVLANLFKTNKKEYDRFFRAIRLHNSACKNEMDDKNTSIVLLAGALEALFDYSSPSTKYKFSYAAKTHLGFREEVEIWAEEFYELRSKIIHGTKVSEEELLLSGEYLRKAKSKRRKRLMKTRHLSHFEIGKEVFENCMFLQLENMGKVMVKPNYKREIIRNVVNRIRPNLDKINSLLQDRRYTFENFKRDRKLYKSFLLRIESLTPLDYSGSKKIKLLLEKILKITQEWIKKEVLLKIAEARKDNKIPRNYLNSVESVIKKILKYIPTLRTVNYGFELDNKIQEAQELCRQFDPIVYSKKEFKFSLGVFLSRSLKSLWGTFTYDIGRGMPKKKIRRRRRVRI